MLCFHISRTRKPFDGLVNLSLLVLLCSEINAVVLPMQRLVVSVECHVVSVECHVVSVECHVVSVECHVVSVECHVVSVECHVVSVECHVVSVECHVVSVECHVVSVECHVVSVECHVVSVECHVVSVECRVVLCLQEIELMQNSLNQLKMVQSKFVESQECLGKVTKANVGKDMLVPLTSSVSLLRYIGLVVH